MSRTWGLVAVLAFAAAGVTSPGTAADATSPAESPTPATALPATQGISASWNASPTEAAVGDPITLRLLVTGLPEDTQEVRFPQWGEAWGDAEVRHVGSVQTEAKDWSQTVEVALFRPGQFDPPPVSVEVVRPTETTSLPIDPGPLFTIESVLPADDAEVRPAPPANPKSLPMGEPFLWSAALLGGGLALCLALLVQRTVRGRTANAVADPWTELEQALEQLRSEGSPALALGGLSHALRRFLGRNLSFPAVESTTTQIRRRLRNTGLDPRLLREITDLLGRADGVKFGRQEATQGEATRSIENTLLLGRRVTSFLAPATTDSPTEAGSTETTSPRTGEGPASGATG